MKQGIKTKFPKFVGTFVTRDAFRELNEIARRETEGNRSITLRRAVIEFIARRANGDNAQDSLPRAAEKGSNVTV